MSATSVKESSITNTLYTLHNILLEVGGTIYNIYTEQPFFHLGLRFQNLASKLCLHFVTCAKCATLSIPGAQVSTFQNHDQLSSGAGFKPAPQTCPRPQHPDLH
jgi:hypothetical protein